MGSSYVTGCRLPSKKYISTGTDCTEERCNEIQETMNRLGLQDRGKGEGGSGKQN